jgi:hypothetical protein
MPSVLFFTTNIRVIGFFRKWNYIQTSGCSCMHSPVYYIKQK